MKSRFRTKQRWQIDVIENDSGSKRMHARRVPIVLLKDDGSGTIAIMVGIESCR